MVRSGAVVAVVIGVLLGCSGGGTPEAPSSGGVPAVPLEPAPVETVSGGNPGRQRPGGGGRRDTPAAEPQYHACCELSRPEGPFYQDVDQASCAQWSGKWVEKPECLPVCCHLEVVPTVFGGPPVEFEWRPQGGCTPAEKATLADAVNCPARLN